MHISSLRPRVGLLLACAAFVFLLIAPTARTAPVPVDLRVVDTPGETLAEHIQFTDTVTIRTDPEADCFGPPGGSGHDVTIQGPTALGAVADGGAVDGDLRPLSVTDQFSFGLGVCGIGGREASGSSFWYLKHNHAGAQVAGDQLTVNSGDNVLWYLSPGFPPPPELVLVAPPLARPGEPFQVSVFAYEDDGSRTAAAGATVSGADAPTDANGVATITPGGEGTFRLQATRGTDIPSNTARVVVNAELDPCRAQPGQLIVGSRKRDKIDGTPEPDTIRARGGDDVVRARGGCEDVVNCGRGHDKAKVDGEDVVRRCQRVRLG
jgi:hypothetical protein